MPIFLVHENAVFEDVSLYLSGHAYRNCQFHRCLLVMGDVAAHMDGCEFHTCIWRLEVTVHDEDSWEKVNALLPVMRKTLPYVPSENGNS